MIPEKLLTDVLKFGEERKNEDTENEDGFAVASVRRNKSDYARGGETKGWREKTTANEEGSVQGEGRW